MKLRPPLPSGTGCDNMTVLVIALSARGDDGVVAGAGGASRKRAGGAGAGAAPPAELADARPAKHGRPTELG